MKVVRWRKWEQILLITIVAMMIVNLIVVVTVLLEVA